MPNLLNSLPPNDLATSGSAYCLFTAAGHRFAATADQVSGVAQRPALASVPLAPNWLAGVWHEGSQFLPVLRMPIPVAHSQALLGPASATTAADNEQQVVLVSEGSGRWVLLVDHVAGVHDLDVWPGGEPAPADSSWDSELPPLQLRQWRGEPVWIVDLEAIYAYAETKLGRAWQAAAENSGDMMAGNWGGNVHG